MINLIDCPKGISLQGFPFSIMMEVNLKWLSLFAALADKAAVHSPFIGCPVNPHIRILCRLESHRAHHFLIGFQQTPRVSILWISILGKTGLSASVTIFHSGCLELQQPGHHRLTVSFLPSS